MDEAIRVTIWNEYRHERSGAAAACYPGGIHRTLASFLGASGFAVRTATLDEPGQGLPEEVLRDTDVLVWWGHTAHQEVPDAVVDRVQARVLEGMGFIPLHSSHLSKPFRRLMGTSGSLVWRVAGERERLWVVAPDHPVAEGLPDQFIVEPEEMYGEPFDIPRPDELVLISWFQGGEVFRSGCCFHRGLGRIFYFRPGHETFPTFRNPWVQRVIVNAVRWAARRESHGLRARRLPLEARDPLEPLKK